MLLKRLIVWSVNLNGIRKEMFNVFFVVFWLFLSFSFAFAYVLLILFVSLWGGRGVRAMSQCSFYQL